MKSRDPLSIAATLVFAMIIVFSSVGVAQAQEKDANVVCNGCVGTRDLATSAVTNAKIRKNQIAFNRLNKKLRNRIKRLERKLAKLEASTAFDLADYVSVVMVEQVTADGRKLILPTVRFEAVNVQIVDGTGQTIPVATTGTEGPNGLGNLVIGYNEERNGGRLTCSVGRFETQSDCDANGARWAIHHRTGSHNLVVGPGNNYSQAGGVVFGLQNTVNSNWASVGGGANNVASGRFASVSGGERNTASGAGASVSGGDRNTASQFSSSVSGGRGNMASGGSASVSGGDDNTAGGQYASVSGGEGNTASGVFASVSGGLQNTASGIIASVSGGVRNSASGAQASVSGGDRNRASGAQASVSGGLRNLASGSYSSVSGGWRRVMSSTRGWRAGGFVQSH